MCAVFIDNCLSWVRECRLYFVISDSSGWSTCRLLLRIHLNSELWNNQLSNSWEVSSTVACCAVTSSRWA